MNLLCVEHADLLVTMDKDRREIADGAVVIAEGAIAWVGATSELPLAFQAAEVQRLNARGRIVLPGFVNTHHHFYQTLTRVIPAAQDAVLFDER